MQSAPPGVVAASPDSARELSLPADVTPIDLAASADGPEVALLLRTAGGARVVTWKAGDDHTSLIADLPTGFAAHAIASHPARHSLFVSGTIGGTSEIHALTRVGSTWHDTVIFQSPRDIGRLILGPRPFGTGDSTRYRVFFAAKLPDGGSSLRSVTETGTLEYQVAGPKSAAVAVKGAEDQPAGPIVPSAIPVTVHPRGEPLIWKDGRGCTHALTFANKNWTTDAILSAVPCDGSLSLTPNGRSYLHWRNGAPGLLVLSDDGHPIDRQATGYVFAIAPVSVPDGKGVIGFVARGVGHSPQAGRPESDLHTAVVYAPIAVPLADVANAWQLGGNVCEEKMLIRNAGLFRERSSGEQLYSLYAAYDYGTDFAPPFLVTTDLFWENFGAAFNGAFIVLERRQALPAFWAFVNAANAALSNATPGSLWAQAFDALAALHRGVRTGEAGRIAGDGSSTPSTVLGPDFNFAELRPRSHYTTSPEMKEYFRAVHYLTEVGRLKDPAVLASLPEDAQRKAVAWIDVYRPFIAPSRAKLIWTTAAPALLAPYARHPWTHPTVFPLSWGLDNEVLESSVFHSTWPQDEQIIGPSGPRMLASGLDVATAFGGSFARSLLSSDFANFPRLAPVLDGIATRRPAMTGSSAVSERWLNALAVEWADSTAFPGAPPTSDVWSTKRLQTGLASWATLREATVLVNERPSAAEAGERGFEELVAEIPRGYVEPAPKTFEAIAALYDALAGQIAGTRDLDSSVANTPWADEPLRQGILKRLATSAAEARRFEQMAEKERRGEALTDSEYGAIRDIGGSAEHQFLVYKSLANKDLAIPTPEPLPKIADVTGDLKDGLLEVAVGEPLEWRQIAPYFGRRQIVVGSIYSYYEFFSSTLYDNARWRTEVGARPRPPWVVPFIAQSDNACRAAATSR